jgi:hypothetical protein
MTATKDNFFDPAKKRNKAAETDHTARAIIAQEAKAREKKTEKLRKLRLEQQGLEEQVADASQAAKPRKKTGSTRAKRKAMA